MPRPKKQRSLFPTNPLLASPIEGVDYSAVRPRDYVPLLLYIETVAVDRDGEMDPWRLNAADRRILEFWDDVGFIRYFAAPCLVGLTDRAMKAAQQLRWERVKARDKTKERADE